MTEKIQNSKFKIQNLDKLPVMEHFYTIQGEGAFAGHAAYFIRLGGCDVGCHWCDVKESWPMEGHQMLEIQEIITIVKTTNAQIVVITGGEPLMHNLDNLTFELQKEGIRTHIETSGAHPLTGNWDWICLSPKKFKATLANIYDFVDELKIIVFNKSDFEYALSEKAKVKNVNAKYFLQAEWGQKEKMYSQIIDFVKNNPSWNISVQTHKYLDIP